LPFHQDDHALWLRLHRLRGHDNPDPVSGNYLSTKVSDIVRTNRFMTRLASGIVAVAAAAATTVLIGGVASAAVLPDDHTVTTTTLVMAPSSSAQTLTARLTPATARGSVQFMDGVTPLGNPVPVTNGTGTITLTLPAGEHSLSAVFNPTDRTAFNRSTSNTVHCDFGNQQGNRGYPRYRDNSGGNRGNQGDPSIVNGNLCGLCSILNILGQLNIPNLGNSGISGGNRGNLSHPGIQGGNRGNRNYPGIQDCNQGNLSYPSILGGNRCGLGGIQGNLSGIRSNLGVPGNANNRNNPHSIPANWAGAR
jgi:hypothetical protein